MEGKLSYEEYLLIVEKAPIMIWRSNTTMECDYFNDVWLEFTGRTLEQERGNGWAEGVHKDDLDRCIEIYAGNFKRRAVFEMEYRLRRADGAYRWIFDRGVPCYGTDGQFRGYIGSCVDVTARIEAEELLRKTQENEIEQLRGILPICAYCKKIRNDDSYWEKLETYLGKHSNVQFSHGICPDCAAKVFSQLEK